MIEIDRNGDVVIAGINGDVDMANTHPIEQAIADAVTSELPGFVLDLSGVTYLDSAGVRLLYRLDERAGGRQQQLVVVVPSDAPINRTLEAAGALGSLRIVATRAEAADLLSR